MEQRKTLARRRRRAFERLETLTGVTTLISTMTMVGCGLYLGTRMDGFEILVVSTMAGMAAGLLAMSGMSDFYRRYVDGGKDRTRPGGRQDG